MQFKTLKHKTLPDTFGIITKSLDYTVSTEIYHGTMPALMGRLATMADIRNLYTGYTKILEQLDDYELVTVELKIIES